MPPKQQLTEQLIKEQVNSVDSNYAAYQAEVNPDKKIEHLRNAIAASAQLVKFGILSTDIQMHLIFAKLHTLVINAITEKAGVEKDTGKKLELLNDAIAESMKALKFDPTHEILKENLNTCHDNLIFTQKHEMQMMGHTELSGEVALVNLPLHSESNFV